MSWPQCLHNKSSQIINKPHPLFESRATPLLWVQINFLLVIDWILFDQIMWYSFSYFIFTIRIFLMILTKFTVSENASDVYPVKLFSKKAVSCPELNEAEWLRKFKTCFQTSTRISAVQFQIFQWTDQRSFSAYRVSTFF